MPLKKSLIHFWNRHVLHKKKEPRQQGLYVPLVHECGRWTYSHPNIDVVAYDVCIGSFTSIGPNVTLGHGVHPTNYSVTSPYFYFDNLNWKLPEMVAHNEFWEMPSIRVGNDVWIGTGVFVKNGIVIGDGAIIGAGTIVTKDVPPYAIVVGNPGRILRYRFNENVRARLLLTRWWNMPASVLRMMPYVNADETLAYLESVVRKRNRLAIFFFYDREGIVDEYVCRYLSEIATVAREICVVVNGSLTQEGRRRLEEYAGKVIVRKNEGLDAWAYKEAIDRYSQSELAQFEEVFMTNFTAFGPFVPLTGVFDAMAKRACDLWSLHEWRDPNTGIAHIPSWFVVYRANCVRSAAFKEYWSSMPKIRNYSDSVELHEHRQVPFFRAAGFRIDVWSDCEQYLHCEDECWHLVCSDKMLIDYGIPFVKRRVFYVERNLVPNYVVMKKILVFLQSRHCDWLDCIRSNILRTQPYGRLDKNYVRQIIYRTKSMFHWNRRLREKYSKKCDVAPVGYIYKRCFKC